ncbi:MAG TPA: 1-deoxy-D-xylulose-5-phosphate synthase N-terminal domain-containing protein, partial [Synergistaceae bacterium]|nr:1-deoxy-D-xylulose-5-phosphate synthase N-terminal domain-containing protein [Synergistaceae bacterium]
MALLDTVNSPEDLQRLAPGALPWLCAELRKKIIETTLKNGGHLASSLGAVELIVALLRTFNFREDRIVFDVGHQTYAYKLLTGRKDRFDTLRRQGGLSGYPKRDESPFDHFDVG